MFPLVVDLRSRRVLVIGAGRVGAHKVSQLLAAGARVTVITEEVLSAIAPEIESMVRRSYQYGDLDGAFLVVAATGDETVNDLIVEEAHERNILLNVVDDAGRSNFFYRGAPRRRRGGFGINRGRFAGPRAVGAQRGGVSFAQESGRGGPTTSKRT
jgi:siroheme synthase-like protein